MQQQDVEKDDEPDIAEEQENTPLLGLLVSETPAFIALSVTEHFLHRKW